MLNRSHDEKVKDLIQRFAEAELNLQEFLAGKVDAVINPITGQTLLMREAQELLLETEARYRHVLTGTSAIIFELTSKGEIFFVNDTVTSITGYLPDEVRGQNWWEVFFPREHHHLGKALLLKLEVGDISNYEVDLTAKNGLTVTLELSSANQYHEDKMLKRVFCLGLNVTERKKEIEKLQESEANYRRIVETTFEGVLTSNTRGILTFVNQRLADMLGYTVEELVGRPVFDFMDDESQAVSKEHLKKRSEGLREKYELKFQRKDGADISFHLSASPIINKQGEFLGGLAVLSDITEHKQIEEQLRQSLKMDAVGRLAGGIAHDFNNILALILLSIDNPDVTLGMEAIREAAVRAATLTRQLLAFSRQQVVHAQTLELNIIVTDSEKLLRRLIGEDIEIVTSLDPNLGLIKADRGQIEQVIMNLVINSRDAMPKGGKLTIETHNVIVDKQNPLTLLKHVPDGKYVMLSVTDTGTGIDKATISHIFEPFFTTKEQGKGTGLGLSILFGIVKQSGGEVSVESKVAQGTNFKIYLPTFLGEKEIAKADAPKVDVLIGTETILYVEDDKTLRKVTSNLLRNMGYTVYEAENGRAALSVFEKNKENIHLIISDVIMPEMSGPDFISKLKTTREEKKTIKILFVSGYSGRDLNRHLNTEQGVAFLEKPYSSEKFLKKVRDTLGEK